jgi:hypothetical protein
MVRFVLYFGGKEKFNTLCYSKNQRCRSNDGALSEIALERHERVGAAVVSAKSRVYCNP